MKTKLLLLLVPIVLAACANGGGGSYSTPARAPIAAAPAALPAGPGNDYYPLTPGTQIVYDVYAVTGLWHGDSDPQMDITSRVLQPDQQVVSFSSSVCADIFGSQRAAVLAYSTGTIPDNPINWSHTHQDGVWQADGINYIGEYVAETGHVEYPPEGVFSYAPVVGEVIDTTSVIYAGCSDKTVLVPAFHWRYQTIAHYDTWGPWKDAWRVSLHEYNSEGGGGLDHVYNYVYAKGIGVVDNWYGLLDPATGKVTGGYEYWAVKW